MAPKRTFVYDPRGISPVTKGAVPFRRPNLHGAVFGVIENSKPNFDIYATRLLDVLTKDHKLGDSLYVAKEAATIPAEDQDYERLTGLCDLVFTGSGD